MGLGSGGLGAGLKGDCLATADVNGDGLTDFLYSAGGGILALQTVVGCLRGANRCFANNGDGTFSDAGEALGLTRRLFNTRGIAAPDINRDGTPDIVLNNEGQSAVVLLGNAPRLPTLLPRRETKAAAEAAAGGAAGRRRLWRDSGS